jgi:squalene-associated FAD-dependent desaturase
MARSIAIVGAGYAGMAAAVRLADAKSSVTVFESGPVPGGRARRIVSQGNELDNGQHILVGAYTQLLWMMGLAEVPAESVLRMPLELRYADGFAFRALRLPGRLGLLGGLLAARRLPLAERFGAVKFLFRMRNQSFRLERDIPVDELLRAHRQDGTIGRYLWRPLCISALNTPTLQASSNAFLAALRDTLAGPDGASDLILPRVDLSKLFPEPAAQFVRRHGGEVRLRSPVENVRELRKQFDAVIVAVGPHQLKALLPELAPDYTYQPINTCYLQYSQNVRLPLAMLGLSDGLVQWVFDRGRLTGEKGLLAAVISAQGDHQQMTQDELADTCHRELSGNGLVNRKPVWTRVIAEKRATITCAPGVPRPGVETGIPGVFLAGDYTDPEYPPTLEAAVRSGVRAAEMVLGGV